MPFDVRDCSVDPAATNIFLTNAVEAYAKLANISQINTVRTVEVDNNTLAYLGPASIPEETDFQASTLALGTQCHPISKQCHLHAEEGASEPFNCTSAFFGNLAQPEVSWESEGATSYQRTGPVYFNSPDFTVKANTTFNTSQQNPYYIGAWAAINLQMTEKQMQDPNIVNPEHGGLTWVLNCTSTAYDLTYSWVNGSVHSANATKANGTTSTVLQSPLFYNLGYSYL